VLKGSLEVVEFVPRRVAEDAAGAVDTLEPESIWARLRFSRALASCLSALASVALHVLFVGPALWTSGAPPQHSSDGKNAGDTALQWIVLDGSSTTRTVTPPTLSAPALVAIGLPNALAAPSWAPPVSETSKDKDSQPEDESSLGAMYGRYVGQIQARIERAWLRPRTAIGAPIFRCQVQVDQDPQGKVGAVTLVDCNGDERWKLSLVRAIERASPLPSPPTSAVFAPHMLLEFRAAAYARGASDALYEPAALAAANAGPQQHRLQSEGLFQALRAASRSAHSKVLELRIQGSSAEVEPHSQ